MIKYIIVIIIIVFLVDYITSVIKKEEKEKDIERFNLLNEEEQKKRWENRRK